MKLQLPIIVKLIVPLKLHYFYYQRYFHNFVTINKYINCYSHHYYRHRHHRYRVNTERGMYRSLVPLFSDRN